MERRFAHVCLLVHDIKQAIEDYRAILGVVDPQQLEDELVYYEDFGMGNERLAFATFPSDGCEIQFMQPKTPGTPLWERLQSRGEHVHHICFTSPNVDNIVEQLKQAEVDIVPQGISHDPDMPFQRWTFVHPERSHGVLVELANDYASVDGRWAAAESAEQLGS
ncbi:VOC family protein [Conexibacter sp. DBS9H8]|uniref:VOC family protein n=1 Tax=Conexibacter sp. DBS9H8 TaxID=2937801 RepID=UPI00200CAA4E|nr:VOC family protein [Conexibacter sp. DBS9H8]